MLPPPYSEGWRLSEGRDLSKPHLTKRGAPEALKACLPPGRPLCAGRGSGRSEPGGSLPYQAQGCPPPPPFRWGWEPAAPISLTTSRHDECIREPKQSSLHILHVILTSQTEQVN